jgi:hypothetical protein
MNPEHIFQTACAVNNRRIQEHDANVDKLEKAGWRTDGNFWNHPKVANGNVVFRFEDALRVEAGRENA